MGLVEAKAGLVTGGGSGIGKAAALAFAREGAQVLVADIDIDAAQATAREASEVGARALAVHVDVANEESIAAMVAHAISEFGRIDFAHNNAAAQSPVMPLADYTLADWDRTIRTNLTSVFLSLKYEIEAMLSVGNAGSIVNMSSTAGVVGLPGMPAYVAGKHGVAGLTKVAALDYATKNIRVNAICPGWVETPTVTAALSGNDEARQSALSTEPIGRFADPDEIAQAVVWLCSDRSSFATGSIMAVDGGYTTR